MIETSMWKGTFGWVVAVEGNNSQSSVVLGETRQLGSEGETTWVTGISLAPSAVGKGQEDTNASNHSVLVKGEEGK
jgi:hypothetical protein